MQTERGIFAEKLDLCKFRRGGIKDAQKHVF